MIRLGKDKVAGALIVVGAIALLFFAITAPSCRSLYADGVYTARDEVDGEGYRTTATVSVESGRIVAVDCSIQDVFRDRAFDASYEEVMGGNEAYREQCRNDLAGLSAYCEALIRTQDLAEVDGISGATWAHNKFRGTVGRALRDAMNTEN